MRRRLTELLIVAVLGVVLGYVGLGARRTEPPPHPPVGELPTAAGEGDDEEDALPTDALAGAERAPEVTAAAPVADDPPVSPAEERNREAVTASNGGEIDRAVELLREARRLEPENALYRTNLQAVLINAGYAELHEERFREALRRFNEALALGDRGEIRRGLGYAYYRTNEPEQARTNLERAITQGAGDADTFLTLGRIHLDRHDQTHALAMLKQAVAAGADSPGLGDTIARLERDAAAEADYHALGSSHFVIKVEGREDTEAARTVLNALEDAYRRVGARFAYYPLDRVEVVLYPDQTFREVTGSPHWSGGIYDGRIKMPIGGIARGTERLARTVRHEYAHAAIVTLSKSKAPVWLNEGLAQVAEETDDAGRTHRLRMAVADGGVLPLTDLEGGFTRFDRDQASLAYAEAYFAAKYLLEHKGAYNVRRLLEAMGTADTNDAAFKQALGMTYGEFERHLLAALERAVG